MSHELGSKPKKLFSGVRGYNAFMKKVISVNAYADSKTTRYHLKIINYYRKFGLEATLATFPIVWVNTNSITAIDNIPVNASSQKVAELIELAVTPLPEGWSVLMVSDGVLDNFHPDDISSLTVV